jgi:PAS domain S-box-containing protein
MMNMVDILEVVVGGLLIAGIVTWLLVFLYSHGIGQLKNYQRAFDLSPEMIVLLHPINGRIMEVNGRAQELTGYPPGDLVGRSVLEWPNLPEESKQLTLQHLRKRTSGERVPPYEMEIRTQAGQRLVCRVQVAPLIDRQGKVKADMISIFDITDSKLAEERLQQMLGDVEKYNRLMVGREMRVVELKQEVNALLQQAGRPPAYPIGEASGAPQLAGEATSQHVAACHPENPA